MGFCLGMGETETLFRTRWTVIIAHWPDETIRADQPRLLVCWSSIAILIIIIIIMMEMTSFLRCYDFVGRPPPPPLFFRQTSIFLGILWSLVVAVRLADANFNLYMDRHEVNRTLGETYFLGIHFITFHWQVRGNKLCVSHRHRETSLLLVFPRNEHSKVHKVFIAIFPRVIVASFIKYMALGSTLVVKIALGKRSLAQLLNQLTWKKEMRVTSFW